MAALATSEKWMERCRPRQLLLDRVRAGFWVLCRLLFRLVCLSMVLEAGCACLPLFGEVQQQARERTEQAEQTGAPVLTQVAQIHKLASQLASRTRVHVTGTITYYDADEKSLFVQDETGAVSVDIARAYPVHGGDRIAIDGRVEAGYRNEIAPLPEIRLLGRGRNFAAAPVTYAQMVTGDFDCRLVRIRGNVRAAGFELHGKTLYLHMDLVMPGGKSEVYVKSFAGFDPKLLLDADVELTGVQAGAFDGKEELIGLILLVQDASAVRVIKRAAHGVEQLPVTGMDGLFSSLRIEDTSPRLHIRGILTYYNDGDSAVLEHDGRNTYVQTRETNRLEIGDEVDAYGFACDHQFAPCLQEAFLVRTGRQRLTVPRSVSYSRALSGGLSDNLIALNGILVSEFRESNIDNFVVDIGGHLITALLTGGPPSSHLLPGSRVRITGICRTVPGLERRFPFVFRIEMRTLDDVQLIDLPSWWTIRHMVYILGVLLTAALAIATWAIVLRRRVVQQSLRIQRSMNLAGERSRILEKISSNLAPEAILSEICGSVMVLLPGAKCFYLPVPEGGVAAAGVEATPGSDHAVCFEVALTAEGGQPMGRVLVSSPRDRRRIKDESQVYAMLSELATLSMRQSLLHEELVYHSNHDTLTGLPNRRFCEDRLVNALADASKQAEQLALVYIDVNRFKQVNDSYGHKVGDLYLQQIGERLRSQIRSTDTLARIGGDEFLVIAPLHANAAYAAILMDRLLACFEEPFWLDGQRVSGSASLGLACYPEDGMTSEELQRKADHAMYLAKALRAGSAAAVDEDALVSLENHSV